jgi:hypothetical protein
LGDKGDVPKCAPNADLWSPREIPGLPPLKDGRGEGDGDGEDIGFITGVICVSNDLSNSSSSFDSNF